MNLHMLKNLLRWKTSPHALGATLVEMNHVMTGLLVEANGTPDMAVDVSAGLVRLAEATVYVPASANLAITAAHATLDRIDLVTVNAAGAVVMVNGTAAATPEAPDLPAGSIELARITVPAADTTIAQSQISFEQRGQL